MTAVDITTWSLGKAATCLAKRLGARKISEGANYQRLSGDALKRSRYYRLPDGRELRISDHLDRRHEGMRSSIDVIWTEAAGGDGAEAIILYGDDGYGRAKAFELNHEGNGADREYYDEAWFNGNGAAFTAALFAKLEEIA